MYVLAVLTQHGITDSFLIVYTYQCVSHLYLQGGSLQGGVIIFRFSFRIMLGLWLLMMVVMVNLYGSTVTSYFTVTKLKPIPTSLEELAATIGQQKCLLTLQKQHPVLALVQVPYVLLEYSLSI